MMNGKITVSLDPIAQMMSILCEGVSNQPNEIIGLNMINENSVKILVNSYLILEYNKEPYKTKINFKNSLKYIINFIPEDKLWNMLSDQCFIVDFPESMSLIEFYKRLWNYMFPNENYKINVNEKENYTFIKQHIF